MKSSESLLKRIEISRDILKGKPVIKGTRVPVEIILRSLAQGMNTDEICEGYEISEEDVRAAILYAQKIIESETVIV
jgi:uncharacterized protein (DUF433 family)